MVDLAGLIVKLTPSGIRETTSQLSAFEKKAKEAAKANTELGTTQNAAGQALMQFEHQVKGFTTGPLAMLTKAASALGLAFAGWKLVDFVKGVVDTGRSFELLGKQLEFVMGSAEGGRKALAWIDEFTLKTPLQTEQVAKSFNMLKVMGIDPMTGSLQAIVDAASATSQGFEGVEGITRQLTQAWAKGKIAGEEVLRLNERFVPVYDLLAEKTGKSTQELRKMAEESKLGREYITLLFEAMGERYAGAAAKQMETLEGEISNLIQTFTFMKREIAKGDVFFAVKDAIVDLRQGIEGLIENGQLERVGDAIGGIIRSFTANLPTIIDQVVAGLEKLPGILERVKDLIGWLIDNGKNLGIIFGAIWATGKILAFVDAIGKAKTAMVAFNAVVAANPVGALMTAIAVALPLAWELGKAIADWTNKLNALPKNTFATMNSDIAGAMERFQRAMKEAVPKDLMEDWFKSAIPDPDEYAAADLTAKWEALFRAFWQQTEGGTKALGQWGKVVGAYIALTVEAGDRTADFTAELEKVGGAGGVIPDVADKLKVFPNLIWGNFIKGSADAVMQIGNMGREFRKLGDKDLPDYRSEMIGAAKDQSYLGNELEMTLGPLNAFGIELGKGTAAAAARAKTEKELRGEFNQLQPAARDLENAMILLNQKHSVAYETVKKLTEGTKNQKLSFEQVKGVAAEFGWDLEKLITAIEYARANGLDLNDVLHNMQKEMEDAGFYASLFKQSVADLFGETFTSLLHGELEDVGEVIESFFLDLAESVGKKFAYTLADWMFGEKKWSDIKELFWKEDASKPGGGDTGPLGGLVGGLAGASMMYAGYQQGGSAGMFSGAMGGAMTGFAIGAAMTKAALAGASAGPIGMAIGAVVGAALAYFGGGGSAESPHVRARYTTGGDFGSLTWGEGFQVYGSGGHLGFSDEERRIWEKEMNAAKDAMYMQYREALQAFGMPDLYGMLKDAFEAQDFGKFEGSQKELAEWLAKEWIPGQLDTIFGDAFRAGFAEFGMSDEAIGALFEELSNLEGKARIEQLTQFVKVVREASEFLLKDWEALKADLEKTSFQDYLDTMDEATDQMNLLADGWEDLSLLQRADELEKIGDVFEAVMKDTLDMLRKIEAVSKSVRDSWAAMVEGIEMEMMSPQETHSYLYRKVQELMEQLRGAESPEAVEEITRQLQRYMGMIRQNVDLEALVDPMGWFGDERNWGEYLIDLINEADAIAQDRLGRMEEEARERYEAAYAAYERATQGVLNFADALEGVTGTDPLGWGDPELNWGFGDPGEIGGAIGGAIDAPAIGAAIAQGIIMPTPIVYVTVYADGTTGYETGLGPPPDQPVGGIG